MYLRKSSTIQLSKNEVHCYIANIDNGLHKLQGYLSILSEDEIIKANKFKFLIDKNRFIVSRGILRKISGHYLNQDPREVVFKYGKYGKPMYRDIQNLNFNISHSGNMVVLGFVRDSEIGVDVEKIKADFDVLGIAQNFFSTREVKSLLNIPLEHQYRAFYRCWTRKESFIKAKGSGLTIPLHSFAVSLDSDEKAEFLETNWNLNEKNNWKLFSFVPSHNYIGALSVQGSGYSVKYIDGESFY